MSIQFLSLLPSLDKMSSTGFFFTSSSLAWWETLLPQHYTVVSDEL